MDEPKVKLTYRGEETPEIRAYLDAVESAMNQRDTAAAAIRAVTLANTFGSAEVILNSDDMFEARIPSGN